jgi:molybdopterin synthase catalytic subunit
MIEVTESALDVARLFAAVDADGAGSVVVHVGVVKGEPAGGGKSAGLTLARGGDMENELAAIEADLRSRFPLVGVVIARRLGRLEVGDHILFVGVSAKDRDRAFAACRDALERTKSMKTLRKEERYL